MLYLKIKKIWLFLCGIGKYVSNIELLLTFFKKSEIFSRVCFCILSDLAKFEGSEYFIEKLLVWLLEMKTN